MHFGQSLLAMPNGIWVGEHNYGKIGKNPTHAQ